MLDIEIDHDEEETVNRTELRDLKSRTHSLTKLTAASPQPKPLPDPHPLLDVRSNKEGILSNIHAAEDPLETMKKNNPKSTHKMPSEPSPDKPTRRITREDEGSDTQGRQRPPRHQSHRHGVQGLQQIHVGYWMQNIQCQRQPGSATCPGAPHCRGPRQARQHSCQTDTNPNGHQQD